MPTCGVRHRFEVGAALVAAGEEAVLGLQRLYWYFVEFGFSEEPLRAGTLGAGIMSSLEKPTTWS